MLKFADLLEKNVDKLAHLESIAMGQPISVAKLMIKGPAALWRYYAGYAGKVSGEDFSHLMRMEPIRSCSMSLSVSVQVSAHGNGTPRPCSVEDGPSNGSW